MGPSPRVRGILERDVGWRFQRGSIPACAGNPRRIWRRRWVMRVHPRVCGESRSEAGGVLNRAGPSPRVRGIPTVAWGGAVATGSIPACAGNPERAPPRCFRSRVHPRVCGESGTSVPSLMMSTGPSPRVRGIRRLDLEADLIGGSIPACAGNPRGRSGATASRGVHPRVCGESTVAESIQGSQRGPSPRVRGIRDVALDGGVATGSIPACAGNPRSVIVIRTAPRVHPRVCGESGRPPGSRCRGSGPSPRVRGILPADPQAALLPGSIPACAGNPTTSPRSVPLAWVHPRVCGESRHAPFHPAFLGGPSPRVRGIRQNAQGRRPGRGSIPACAGNPVEDPDCLRVGGVHPRVCGESSRGFASPILMVGPSPRVRGIRIQRFL